MTKSSALSSVPMRRWRAIAVVTGTVIVVLLLGCDDRPKTPVAAAPPQRIAVPAAAPVAATASEEGARAQPELTDLDFIEGPNNRDPFRSYLLEFVARGSRLPSIQRKVLLQRYGLDELSLIAVVTGEVEAQAMFRDPAGLGVTVKRGDYISKSAGMVKQILSDRVVIQIQEEAEGSQAWADRVVQLHPARERQEDSGI